MTLDEYNREQGIEQDGEVPCSRCGQENPTFCLTQSGDNWVCGSCRTDADRIKRAAIDAARDQSAWSSDCGAWMRNERNRLLDQWRWTIMPDSPLSAVCQGKFVAYLKRLQRMTVDCATTADWHWPIVPALEYPLASASVTVVTK